MSFRDEINQVVQEEERKLRRRTNQVQRTNRFVRPTYWAIIVAKIIVFINSHKKQPLPAETRQVAKQKKKVTMMSLVKEDLRNLRRKIFPVKKVKKLPGSNESWKDWEGQI